MTRSDSFCYPDTFSNAAGLNETARSGFVTVSFPHRTSGVFCVYLFIRDGLSFRPSGDGGGEKSISSDCLHLQQD